MPTTEDILRALSSCQEPELHQDIVSLGMIQNVRVTGAGVSFDYVLTTPACPLKNMMEDEARVAVLRVPGVKTVKINMVANVKRDMRLERILPSGVRNIIAVGSGKGGVGKSTVACNLATALALDGAKVGLMDADVYGPNQPQMLGIKSFKPEPNAENKITPPENYGVKLMSMGFLVDPDVPVIWRGPMLHSAVTQFLKDVEWGDLDYLVVDLPPGTGDVQLSLCQAVPLVGAVIVTTPQSIALSDVRKAVGMFDKLHVPVLGIVENMSEFACPHCHEKSEIFSHGGAKTLSEKYSVPVVGSIPLDPEVCQTGEVGRPISVSHPDTASAKAFREMARRVAAQVSLRSAQYKPLEIKVAAE